MICTYHVNRMELIVLEYPDVEEVILKVKLATFAKLKYFYCKPQTSYSDSENGDLLIFFCHIYPT